MNTEQIIEFIKNGITVKNELKTWMYFYMVLGMSFVICLIMESYGKALLFFSVITSIIVVAVNVCYFVAVRKSIKYKLFSGMVTALDFVFPFFYLFCISYCETFGLWNFVLLYFLPFLFVSFFCL